MVKNHREEEFKHSIDSPFFKVQVHNDSFLKAKEDDERPSAYFNHPGQSMNIPMSMHFPQQILPIIQQNATETDELCYTEFNDDEKVIKNYNFDQMIQNEPESSLPLLGLKSGKIMFKEGTFEPIIEEQTIEKIEYVKNVLMKSPVITVSKLEDRKIMDFSRT